MSKYKYVPARHYQKADRKVIEGIVIHTAETPEHGSVAENLQSWTAGPNANVSSWHYAVDNDSITQSVLEKDVAWHAGPANGWTIGIELAGKASQTSAQWDDDYSRAVLENAAKLVARIAGDYGIPVEKLSADDLKAGKRKGIFGHVDVTNGLTNGKGHTDPGKSFPWEKFIARVRELVIYTKPIVITPIPPVIRPSELAPGPELRGFVELEHAGDTWLVCPVYVGPIGIGQARDVAKQLGCELPTPGLVDAIWRAADLKIDATKMIVSNHDGTPRTMNSPEVHARQCEKIAREVAGRALGKDFFLLAGAFKDVVQRINPSTGAPQIGLYGWHRASGAPIQSFYGGHAMAWQDYSQGLRLCRRVVKP